MLQDKSRFHLTFVYIDISCYRLIIIYSISYIILHNKSIKFHYIELQGCVFCQIILLENILHQTKKKKVLQEAHRLKEKNQLKCRILGQNNRTDRYISLNPVWSQNKYGQFVSKFQARQLSYIFLDSLFCFSFSDLMKLLLQKACQRVTRFMLQRKLNQNPHK